MSILLVACILALIAIYYCIQSLLYFSGVRYLIDAYGLSRQKLRPLKHQEIKELRKSIDQLRKSNDPYALETLIKPYRA